MDIYYEGVRMNIFVGNMNRDVTKETLKKEFNDYGEVETVTILIDRINGEWKAFGFVEMPNRDEAFNAISALDNKEFFGKNLIVHEARYRSDDRRTTSRLGGRRHSDVDEYDDIN